MIEAGDGANAERDALRREVEALTADRNDWREKASLLEADLQVSRREVRHWRAETERLVGLDQKRLGTRLRQARHRYARLAWRVVPDGLRNRLRPLIFSKAHHEFIGPEPFQNDDAPGA